MFMALQHTPRLPHPHEQAGSRSQKTAVAGSHHAEPRPRLGLDMKGWILGTATIAVAPKHIKTNEKGLHSLHDAVMGRGTSWAKLLHCVRTECILRTQRPGYSPKNTCHLTSSTAKQQSPQENNETAFNLVLHCPYGQTTQPCKVQLWRGMQDAHMFK